MCNCKMGNFDFPQPPIIGSFSGNKTQKPRKTRKNRKKIMGFFQSPIEKIEDEYGVYYDNGMFYDFETDEYVGYYDFDTEEIVLDEANEYGDAPSTVYKEDAEKKTIDLSAEARMRKQRKTIFFIVLAVVALVLLYFVFKKD